MNMNTVRSQLLANLKASKEYREGFVAEHIKTTIPFQLRAIRKKLGWTQRKLGKKAAMAPERITVLEDPNYAKFTLSTLLRLADALDVALIVRFAPFSELLDWAANLSSEVISVPDFDEEFKQKVVAKHTDQSVSDQAEPTAELIGELTRATQRMDDMKDLGRFRKARSAAPYELDPAPKTPAVFPPPGRYTFPLAEKHTEAVCGL